MNKQDVPRKNKKEDAPRDKTEKSEKSFFAEYKWWLVISCVVLIIGYIVIYFCFRGNGGFPAGLFLEKKDWLSFLGAYLSFSGTAIVSLIALFQSRYYTKQEKQRTLDLRKKTIQPILSVDITSLDSQVNGTAEAVSLSHPESNPKHKNVTISIENVGKYPILNVIVFDCYLWQMLKPMEKKQIQVAYSDSPDIQRWKKHLIELLESDFERSDNGIPKWFNVNYDDIDGNEMFQTYELKDFDGTQYYSLEGTYEA